MKKKTAKKKIAKRQVTLESVWPIGASSVLESICPVQTATGIHAEQSGKFITMYLSHQLAACVTEAIVARREMNYDPKYIEFILPDMICGLKVIK